MFKNKTPKGRNNVCGEVVRRLRTEGTQKFSQRMVAEKMQLQGVDVDKNAIQRIESGQRFVTDIELQALSRIFNVSYDVLMGDGADNDI